MCDQDPVVDSRDADEVIFFEAPERGGHHALRRRVLGGQAVMAQLSVKAG
jgi:hypothetical protein